MDAGLQQPAQPGMAPGAAPGMVPGMVPGEPGQPPGPDAPLDPLEAQMLLEEELLLLMNEPIIPDPLVYCCGCMYLILVTCMMGGLSVFLYTRLTPPSLATAAAETESEVTYTEATVANVTAKRLWEKASESHPLICLVDLATNSKADLATFKTLCVMVVIKNPVIIMGPPNPGISIPSDPSLVPQMKDAARSGVRPLITVSTERRMRAFDRSTLDQELPDIGGFYYQHNPKKPRLLVEAVKTVKRTYTGVNTVHIGFIEFSKLSKQARVLKEFTFAVVAFTVLRADLEQPPVARLPNPWQTYGGLQNEGVLLTALDEAAKNMSQHLLDGSLCFPLTAATFSAEPSPGQTITQPGQPAAKVSLVPFTQVCKLAGAQKEARALTKYVVSQGATKNLMGFDDTETLKAKVISLLTAQPKLCLLVVDADLDDRSMTCDHDVLPLIRTIRITFDSAP